MVNNELSGPCLATFLAEYLDTKKTITHIDLFLFQKQLVCLLI